MRTRFLPARLPWFPALALVPALVTPGCDSDDPMDPHTDPVTFAQVAPILQQSCATTACHDAGGAAAGLILDSYDAVLAGSASGEAVIPFAPDRSLLIELLEGRAASGTVDHNASTVLPVAAGGGSPVEARTLVHDEELETLRSWVAAGCADESGQPAFAEVTERVYVTGQSADLVSVISVEDLVVTRLLPVSPFTGGGSVATPHFGAVSPDNATWFTTLLTGHGLWKYDSSDEVVAKLETGREFPALAVFTPDGAKAYVSHFIEPAAPAPGFVSVIDVSSFTVTAEVTTLNTPHGIAINAAGTEVYVANFNSDHITVIDTSDDTVVEHIPVSETVRGDVGSFVYRVIQIATHPSLPLIYASCMATDEIRVIDRTLGTVVDSMSTTGVGGSPAPWHLKVTPGGQKLYVANRGEPLGSEGTTAGSVSVFWTTPFQHITNVFHEALALPHGLDFDAQGSHCFVSSENLNGAYTARHPIEGQRPGTVAVIDASMDQVIKVLEVEANATGVFATH